MPAHSTHYPCSTLAPARSIRFASLGLLGEWSSVTATAVPRRDSTVKQGSEVSAHAGTERAAGEYAPARESPAWATTRRSPCRKATTAVVPDCQPSVAERASKCSSVICVCVRDGKGGATTTKREPSGNTPGTRPSMRETEMWRSTGKPARANAACWQQTQLHRVQHGHRICGWRCRVSMRWVHKQQMRANTHTANMLVRMRPCALAEIIEPAPCGTVTTVPPAPASPAPDLTDVPLPELIASRSMDATTSCTANGCIRPRKHGCRVEQASPTCDGGTPLPPPSSPPSCRRWCCARRSTSLTAQEAEEGRTKGVGAIAAAQRSRYSDNSGTTTCSSSMLLRSPWDPHVNVSTEDEQWAHPQPYLQTARSGHESRRHSHREEGYQPSNGLGRGY